MVSFFSNKDHQSLEKSLEVVRAMELQSAQDRVRIAILQRRRHTSLEILVALVRAGYHPESAPAKAIEMADLLIEGLKQ